MENTPLITVIMPIRNEAGFIGRSLGAVLAQDYPRDRMEVLIADGMSTDGTRDVIACLAEAYPGIRVTVLDNPGKIVPTGMNAALARAQGEIIVRVDGHTIVAPDYVSECIAALERSGASNVGGRMDPVSEGRFGQATALATSSFFGVGGARFHYSDHEELVDTVYMGAWPRGVFQRIGFFDEELVRNQDDELNYRLRSQGGKILLSPRIKSRYYNRSTNHALWRQYLQYGYWKVRVMQKHPLQMRPRQFVPPLFVSTLLFSSLAAPFFAIGKWMFLLIAVSYVIANLAVSVAIARNRSWRLLPLLPVTFVILHVAYGFGFLMGLVKFWNRWGDPLTNPRGKRYVFTGTASVPLAAKTPRAPSIE
jgi:cellulose synthase/poly-beta-1,6-N-acetylglucosamine synthase-like glycosyltransferase